MKALHRVQLQSAMFIYMGCPGKYLACFSMGHIVAGQKKIKKRQRQDYELLNDFQRRSWSFTCSLLSLPPPEIFRQISAFQAESGMCIIMTGPFIVHVVSY